MQALLDVPVSLAVFYPDNAFPRTPAVAVAAGQFVFTYRNLRPYLKFTLPQVPMTSVEVDALAAYGSAKADGATAAASDSSTGPIGAGAGPAPLKQTVVTCMESIPRDKEGDTEQSSLVIGTEAAQVLYLDAAGSAVERAVSLPSVPVQLIVHGTLKGEHRINVACRDGSVYAIKDRELMVTRIEPPAMPVCCARTEHYLYVGSVDSRVTAFDPKKGKKVFTIPLPASVTAIARLLVKRDRTSDCIGVAMEGGEVRVYNGQSMVASMQCPDTIVAMRFGQYGREGNTLVLASRSGALTFKMIKRTATFEPPQGSTQQQSSSAALPEADVPLAVPKKTRLYLDQTQRERDAAVDMYRIFQRDLCKLRLTTARAYVKAVGDAGGGAAASAGGSIAGTGSGASTGPIQLRLNCIVQGLGPRFKLKLDLQNAGSAPVPDVVLVFQFDRAVYHMEAPVMRVPMLLPVSAGR